MKFDVAAEKNEGAWHEVKIGDQSFEVLVVRPTFMDRTRNLAIRAMASDAPDGQADGILYRIQAAVKDWRGLTDADDKPVPFTWENLQALGAKYSEAFHEIAGLSTDAFSRSGKDGETNAGN